jgi:hypothetical protein
VKCLLLTPSQRAPGCRQYPSACSLNAGVEGAVFSWVPPSHRGAP